MLPASIILYLLWSCFLAASASPHLITVYVSITLQTYSYTHTYIYILYASWHYVDVVFVEEIDILNVRLSLSLFFVCTSPSSVGERKYQLNL